MSVKIRVKRQRLHLDIYVGGQRHWEAIGLTLGSDKAANKETWRLAELIRQKREQQIVSGEWGLLDSLAGKQTLVAYAEQVAKRYSPNHPLSHSVAYLRKHFGELQIGQLHEQAVEGFRHFLLTETTLSKTTASGYFSMLKTIMRRAVRDRVVPHNAAGAIRGIAVPDSDKPLLSTEELQRLARTSPGGELGTEIKRAFMLSCYCGLRISDLKSLLWSEIDRETHEIRKRQKKTSNLVTIPLNESGWALIDDKQLHRRDEKVFPLLETKANLNDYLVRWSTTAGLDRRLGFHDGRRYFASAALAAGADVVTVSRLLGHRKLNQVQAYARTTDALKRQAVDNLPAIEIKERRG